MTLAYFSSRSKVSFQVCHQKPDPSHVKVPLTVDPARYAAQIEAHNSMHFLTYVYVDERCYYIFSGKFLWF
jgi:hypothetical protein